MDLHLKSRVAVVTGATANIGRAIALELAREGAFVVACGRDAEAGARVTHEAKSCGASDAVFVAADLREPEAPIQIVQQAEKFGPLSILVNGVGGNADQGVFTQSDPAKWAQDIDLNFGTVLRMSHAVLPSMIQHGAGDIVNIGSTAGLVGDYALPVYSAMKGAVHAFTVALAKEVGQHGVRVNAVAPYATIAQDPAAFSAGSRFNPANNFFAKSAAMFTEEERALRQRRTFVGRPFAQPEDISGLVAYLVSRRAGFVTGQVWSVDGGALL